MRVNIINVKIEEVLFGIEGVKPEIEAFDDFSNNVFSIIIIKLEKEINENKVII